MRQFLRTVRQARWHKYPEIAWLVEGELQGDVLTDMSTDRGRLSVYRISNEDDLQRVITALAATRDNVANLDYAIFEDSELGSLGITISNGGYNNQWAHYELGNLSARRLARLAEVVSAGNHDRVSEKLIRAGYRMLQVLVIWIEQKLNPKKCRMHYSGTRNYYTETVHAIAIESERSQGSGTSRCARSPTPPGQA